MYDIDLGDGPPNATPPSTHYLELGYDIDGKCTTVADLKQGECKLPPFPGGAAATGVPDGTQGQDNALGKNLQFIRDRIRDFSSVLYSDGLRAGQAANVIINVSGYNGEANDDQVRVETMVAAPFDSYQPGAVPKWDGTDIWPIASDSVNGDRDHPKFVDDLAYVTDYQMVVTLPEATLRLITALTTATTVKLAILMRAANAVCVISPTDAGAFGYELSNCRLSARWQVDDIIHQLSQFPDPIVLPAFKPLCNVPDDNSRYQLFKNSLCSVTDTYSGTVGGVNTVCNSLSMGLGFNAKPGRLGDVFNVAPIVPKCPDPVTDPINDSCAIDSSKGFGAGGGGGAGGSGAGGKAATGGSGGTKTDAGTSKDAGKG